MNRFAWNCLSLATVFTLALRAAEPIPGIEYRVLQKELLGGEGSWDYLSIDSDARRLYISRETRVLVVDLDTRKIVHQIEKTNGVHGIALVSEFNRAYTSNGRDNTVTAFDLKSYEKVGEASAGPKPDAIVYDKFSHRVFAFNNGGTSATAIDAALGTISGQIDLGGAPEFAVADGKGHMFVNLEDKSEVVEFDSTKLTVLNRWPLAPGKTPTGLAMDLEHRRLFSTCRGSKTLVVLDADSGKIVASLPIGAGVDAAVFDPESQNVFASNGDGTLTIIHEDAPDAYHVSQNLTTQPGAKTMALDAKTHQIVLVAAETKPAPENEPNKRKKTIVPGTFSLIIVGK